MDLSTLLSRNSPISYNFWLFRHNCFEKRKERGGIQSALPCVLLWLGGQPVMQQFVTLMRRLIIPAALILLLWAGYLVIASPLHFRYQRQDSCRV